MSINEGNGYKCGTAERHFALKTDDVAYIVGILVVFLKIY